MRFPIRGELRAVNGAVMALESGQQLAAVCVPEPRGPVVGGGQDALLIGGELRAVNGPFMALESGQQLSGVCVPEPCGFRNRFITDCAREMGQSRRCFACNQLFLCHEPIRLGGLFKQGSEFTVFGLKLIPGSYRFPFLRFGIGFSETR
jgi:hypothetical protein